jgi:hypothetical protein
MSELKRLNSWRSSSSARPHFFFVCNHGDPDPDAPLDRVALLPWFPNRPGWAPAEGVDEHAVVLWPMEGDQRGHDAKWLPMPGWTIGPDEPDLRRDAIEIRCPTEHCTTWAYRCDEDSLQTLLTKIATDDKFRNAVTVSADEKLIVMKLKALHLARGHARKHYGLQV